MFYQSENNVFSESKADIEVLSYDFLKYFGVVLFVFVDFFQLTADRTVAQSARPQVGKQIKIKGRSC